jgi:hypothetical protein
MIQGKPTGGVKINSPPNPSSCRVTSTWPSHLPLVPPPCQIDRSSPRTSAQPRVKGGSQADLRYLEVEAIGAASSSVWPWSGLLLLLLAFCIRSIKGKKTSSVQNVVDPEISATLILWERLMISFLMFSHRCIFSSIKLSIIGDFVPS